MWLRSAARGKAFTPKLDMNYDERPLLLSSFATPILGLNNKFKVKLCKAKPIRAEQKKFTAEQDRTRGDSRAICRAANRSPVSPVKPKELSSLSALRSGRTSEYEILLN